VLVTTGGLVSVYTVERVSHMDTPAETERKRERDETHQLKL
jgi:hypothetical protein